ncbi:MAG: hypothetical protein ABIK65_14980 [Candidatus Eisenbacteria bacterium]
MKCKSAIPALFAIALLLLGSVPAGAWDQYPPGPGLTGQIDPDGHGETDPDDFPIIVGTQPSTVLDALLDRARDGGSYARLVLKVWGVLPY